MSKRGDDWKVFAEKVYRHIEDYTVPQYGDEGVDEITHYTSADCVRHIRKYTKRFGQNQRAGQEELDFIKIAHYAQCGMDKLGDIAVEKNSTTFVVDGDSASFAVGQFICEHGLLDKKGIKITIEDV